MDFVALVSGVGRRGYLKMCFAPFGDEFSYRFNTLTFLKHVPALLFIGVFVQVPLRGCACSWQRCGFARICGSSCLVSGSA